MFITLIKIKLIDVKLDVGQRNINSNRADRQCGGGDQKMEQPHPQIQR